MIYNYKCTQINCTERNKEISVTKPIAEAERKEKCKKCNNNLQRMYGLRGHSTFGDGYKTN